MITDSTKPVDTVSFDFNDESSEPSGSLFTSRENSATESLTPATKENYPCFPDDIPPLRSKPNFCFKRNSTIHMDTNCPLQAPLDPRDLQVSDLSLDSTLAKFDSLPSILRHRAQTMGKQNAFISLDSKGKEISVLTWEKLSARAEKVAQVIREKSDLGSGDRVGLFYSDLEVMDFVSSLLGCFLAGVIAVPMNPASSFKDITHILRNTQAHLVLTTDTSLKNLHRLLASQKLQWPKDIEWWKTNEFGSVQSQKKTDLPPLKIPDLAYIEFSRSPIGELRGVVLSHRTILHQMACLGAMLGSKEQPTQRGHFTLCNLDIRQSIGLIVGVLLTIYAGNTTVWIPRLAMATGGLYANVITRYRISIVVSDYPGLKQVAYNYQSFPHLTRNFSKKLSVDLSSICWCLIDAVTVDTEFHEVLQDRWLKPLGNLNYQDVVVPMLTLSEHGGMVIAMRDWIKGQEQMGCRIDPPTMDDENCGPTDLSEVLLDKASLNSNLVKIMTSSPGRNSITEDGRKYIRVGGFGYPLPDATLAIVNPESCMLVPEMQLGEIWIDSPSLSGGFWALGQATNAVFHATCYDYNGPLDMEFLRTGLLGFIFNGKVYVLGLYEDRLRQRIESPNQLDNGKFLKPIGSLMEYRYHFTSHIVNTIMRSVPSVFDCSAFDTLVNGEYYHVLVLESPLASVPALPALPDVPQKNDIVALNDLCKKTMTAVLEGHGVRVYCVIITPPNTLPRIVRSGRSEIGNMLCKRKYDLGILPAVYVKFGIEKVIRNLPVGLDIEGGIWAPGVSQLRAESLHDNERQYSGVDFRDEVIDDRTSAPLCKFDSIVDLLQWRVVHQSGELAFATIDNKTRESSGLSWKKFDRKVATIALTLKNKLLLPAGSHVILMYTHSEDFVAAIYACLITGIIALPVSPMDTHRLQEDVPALLHIIRDYSVGAILLNNDTDSAMKVKTVSNHLKQSALVSKITIPQFYNTSKLKTLTAGCHESHLLVKKEWLAPDYVCLVWLYWTPDHRRQAVGLNHRSIMNMAKIQKETCLMSSLKPVVGCVRSVSGLGFIHTCIMGVYLGTSTLLLSPIDYAQNPLSFFLTLSRYKVKDTYSTPQMIDHACAAVRPTNLMLADTKNLIISFDNRPRTDMCKRFRNIFSPASIDSHAINISYSHVLNPMVTTRSYMSLDPVDIWLDPIALRQGYVSLVNPENYPGSLHLHDSGMVPVGTQVAIVNPETCRLCKTGEYGEIWVYSEGNVTSFYKSKDQFSNDRLAGKVEDGDTNITYARTGDLGFLHNVSRKLPNGSTLEIQTLFVLGSIGETFEVLGLSHFPLDIEHSVERCSKMIVRGGSAVFQAGGLIILVVESIQTSFLAALAPIIVSTILNEHQFVIDIVAFVGKGDFPRSRLNEKQRGKILAAWVTKKLSIREIYGVSQGERHLVSLLQPPQLTQSDVEDEGSVQRLTMSPFDETKVGLEEEENVIEEEDSVQSSTVIAVPEQ